jgi:dienelactone hydrolase
MTKLIESKPFSPRPPRQLILTLWGAFLLLPLTGCGARSDIPLGTIQVPTASTLTLTPSPTSSPTTTSTPTLSPTPTATATPDPYADVTIEGLASRQYGGGSIEVQSFVQVDGKFKRALFSYPSDGLNVAGFINIPQGEGPFPVVLVLHGYVELARFNTLSYTTRYADELARTGFLVLHPNYRNYPPSDGGDNAFRVGYAVDVLNLIALVRSSAGAPGPLESAATTGVGLFGHSMGGGIALRVITIDPSVRAAVLYGSMSGDERQNYEKILEWSEGAEGEEELETPEQDLERISPLYHLARIRAAVSVHHGAADTVVPPEWSQDLCQRLVALEKPIECFLYPGQPHTFYGSGDQQLLERAIDFFARHLQGS